MISNIEEPNSVEILDPKSLYEALEGPDADEWTDAIIAELEAHMENNTWEIVDLPSNHKPIGVRYVFKTELTKTGGRERRKARLVANGFSQIPGTNFNDTFAPVSRASTIRLMMALSVEMNLIVHQMDVVTAFLNGEVEEKIYITVPEKLESLLNEIIKKKISQSTIQVAEKWLKNLQQGNPKTCRL